MQNQRLLLSAIMLAFVSANATADPLTVYGKGNVTLQSTDDGEGSFSEVKSNNSRLGFKGDYDLEDGLTAFYVFEFGVDLADSSDGDNVKSRNQYIGLKGNAGSIMIGRNDTMLKRSQGKIDQFNDFEADVGGLWEAEVRANNSISYFTPSYNGFGAQLTYILEDSVDAEDAVSAALFYGDDNLKDSNIFLSVAFDSEVNGYDSVRVNGQTKVAGVKLGAMLQRQEDIITGLEQDGWLLSGAYPLGKTELKAQYQTLEDDKAVSIGADYKAGKNTTLYAWYSSFNLDLDAPDRDYLAVGIKHKF